MNWSNRLFQSRILHLAVILALFAAALPAAAPVQAVSTTLVISQVYGGGGNSGATLKNDFIELFNLGANPVDVTGWSVQYAPATGTSWSGKTTLSGVIQPGHYYLVQEAAGTGGTVNLPTPDATGSIAMAAGAGKVALVTNSTTLTGTCPTGLVDLVGYGSNANCFEGSGPTGTISASTAALRNGDGLIDTDNNAADFTIGAPNPRNSGSGADAAPTVINTTPANGSSGVALDATINVTFSEPVNVTGGWFTLSCDVSGPHDAAASGGPTTFSLDPVGDFVQDDLCTLTVLAAQVSDQDTIDPPDTMAADFKASFNTVAPPISIHDIQGASHFSSKNGHTETTLPAIVTALRTTGSTRGFYMQDPNPDDNPATSEGIFAFTGGSTNPTVSVGDEVQVTGKVSEFRASSTGNVNLTVTELVGPFTITTVSSGNPLPAPVVLGNGGLIPPSTILENDATGNEETGNTFDPAQDGLDFYESLEGMLVQVNDAVATGPTKDFTSNHEISVVGDNGANAGVRTNRGGVVIGPDDYNPERIILNDWISGGPTLPTVNVGATFPGVIKGVMDYSFNNYKLQVISMPAVGSNDLQQETASGPVIDQLAVATFNVENLAPTDPPEKFATLAELIVGHLLAPDVLAIEEIQDNTGATDTGVVDASTTWGMLIDAIAAAGGPTYDYRQIDPVNDKDGGAPGGNIRVGFLFRTDRGLSFVDRPGAGSTTANSVVASASGPELQFSPGRVDPTNAAFNDSRKPLAGEFFYRGHKLFVIANHFNSKGGDQPLEGVFQPPTLTSEVQRLQQAAVVKGFVQSIYAQDPNANVVVMGDLNDFQFSNPLNVLKSSPLHALIETLPPAEQYTYVFDGNSQAIDHIMFSNGLFARPFLYDVVHVNSEFAVQASDHEPQVVNVTLNDPPTANAGGPYFVVEGGTVTLTATATDPEGDPLSYSWDLDNNGSFETPGQTVSFSAAGITAPATRTVAVQVTDPGGLTGTATTVVNVLYPFSGFFSPVDNLPVLNLVNAGRAIPVKFSLSGDRGLSIFLAGFPQSVKIACDSGAEVDDIEVTQTAGSSGLSYDPTTDTYTYVWKTDKAWANSCRQLIVKLNDGTDHRLNFKFKK